jgi:hypothetical protein
VLDLAGVGVTQFPVEELAKSGTPDAAVLKEGYEIHLPRSKAS